MGVRKFGEIRQLLNSTQAFLFEEWLKDTKSLFMVLSNKGKKKREQQSAAIVNVLYALSSLETEAEAYIQLLQPVQQPSVRNLLMGGVREVEQAVEADDLGKTKIPISHLRGILVSVAGQSGKIGEAGRKLENSLHVLSGQISAARNPKNVNLDDLTIALGEKIQGPVSYDTDGGGFSHLFQETLFGNILKTIPQIFFPIYKRQ